MHQPQPPDPDPDDDLEQLGEPLYQGDGLQVRGLSEEELARFLAAHAGQPARLLGSGWTNLEPPTTAEHAEPERRLTVNRLLHKAGWPGGRLTGVVGWREGRCQGVRPCRHRLLGDGVHDDSASAEELAALRVAVLQSHEELVGTLPGPRTVRVWDGLRRLHLSWLVIPWIVVDAGRMFLSGWRRGFAVGDEQAVGLYRRLSGKDPQVARAEVRRIVMQLGKLDERLRDPDDKRRGAPRGADPDELAVAAGALLGYYLAGRRTGDALLAEIEAAWAESEELTEQLVERSRDRKRIGRGHADPMVEERVQAAADRYRAAWRRWFDGRARQGASAGSGDR